MSVATVGLLWAVLGADPATASPEAIRTDGPPVTLDLLEPPAPFVPKKPLAPEDARLIEAKKLYVLALAHLERRELHRALSTLQKALENDPKSFPILRQLTLLCLQLERGAEARQYAKRALEIKGDDAELLFAYGQQLAEDGNLAEAISVIERAGKAPDLKRNDATLLLAIREQLADLYERKGDPAGAARALAELVDVFENPAGYEVDELAARQLERGKVRYYERLGRALKDSKQFDKAVAALQRGRELDGRGQRLSLVLAEVYFETGDSQKALDEVQAYLRGAQPQDEKVLALYEKILAKLGREEDLLPSLEKLVESDIHNPVLRLFYGQKLIEKKEFKKAKEQLEKIRDRPEVLLLLAKLFRDANDPKEFVETLRPEMLRGSRDESSLSHLIKLLAQDKEFLKKVAEAAKKREDADKRPLQHFYANMIIARAASEAKAIDLAVEFYKRCAQDRPDRVELDLELINVLWSNERYQEVVDYCREALKQKPDEFDLSDYLARGLEMTGKTDEAVKVIDKLIEKLPDRDAIVNAQLVLAWIHQHARNWEQAVAACNRVLNDFPGNRQIPAARYMLASIHALKGDNAAAEKELLKLVEADGESLSPSIIAAANNDLGYLWADEGRNLDRAEEMIRKAVAIAPNNSAYLDSLGWVLFKKKRYPEAVEYLKKAVEMEEASDPVLWDHLGDAYLQVDDFAQATAAWEKAIAGYKKDPKGQNAEKRKQVEQKLELLKKRSPKAPTRATPEAP